MKIRLLNKITVISAAGIFVIFLLMFVLQGTSMAVQITATWTGSTGDWDDTFNWDTANAPNNGVDNYDVRVDDNSGINSVVTLNINNTIIDSLTVDDGDTVSFKNNRKLTVAGSGITNNGTITLNSAGAGNSHITFQGNTSLSGSGEVVMSNSTNNRILTDGSTLTQTASHTIRGTGELLDNTGNMINNGTIRQEGSVTMTIDPNATFTNQGSIVAAGSGGIRLESGIFTNTTAISVENGSELELNTGVTIDGGQLQTTGTGTIKQGGTGAGATLNNVIINGNVTQGDNRDATITGSLHNNGTWNLNSAGNTTDLNFNGGATMDGTGEIVMSNATNNRIRTDGTTLTQGATHTIRGAGQLLANTGSMINSGTIRQEGTNTLVIDPNALGFTNQGLIEAAGSGGISLETGTFTNTGRTISVENGSELELHDGVIINGGTLQASGTGFIDQRGTNVGATLNNVTIEGSVTQADNRDTTITGGLTNNGTWNLNSIGNATDLTFNGNIELNGTGKISMSNHTNNRILSNGSTLTQTANHTIEGAGQIVTAMTNNGTVNANQANELRLSINNKTNNGLMKASNGGTLRALTNVDIDGTGNWEADGGKIQLDSGVDVTTTGAINVLNGGELELNSATMTGSDLTVDSSGILDVNSGITLSGNLLYSIANEADFTWGASSFLQMDGFNSFLELGGEDFGTNPATHTGATGGFSLNFDLTELIIGDGAKLHFADFYDNGNRIDHGFGISEALYVDTLTLDGTGILNLNSLNLYYGELVLLNGATIDQLIDIEAPPLEAVPEPTTIALLGIGLAGLGGRFFRKRFRQKKIATKG